MTSVRGSVRAFVLGQGRRDDGADGVIVGDSGGDVHHGGRGGSVRAFVLGQGRMDDDAEGVVVGNTGGDVHRGGRGTNDGDGNGDGLSAE